LQKPPRSVPFPPPHSLGPDFSKGIIRISSSLSLADSFSFFFFRSFCAFLADGGSHPPWASVCMLSTGEPIHFVSHSIFLLFGFVAGPEGVVTLGVGFYCPPPGFPEIPWADGLEKVFSCCFFSPWLLTIAPFEIVPHPTPVGFFVVPSLPRAFFM